MPDRETGRKIALVFGTRPEAIKLCPLVLALRASPDFTPHVCVTAQHREMLDQILDVFGVVPDVDLNLMRPEQTLAGLTARAVEALDGYLSEHRPEMVLVQGDTTTVLAAALAAFYHRIPVGHVEAGLRTGNRVSPYPEEINRVLTSRLTDLHFAPTEWSRNNLLSEKVPGNQVFVTGNTVIDALQIAVERIEQNTPIIADLPQALQPSATTSETPRVVLITGHRRENFGQGFENICAAIAELAQHFPDTHFVYPMHLNPNVREPVGRILGQSSDGNIHLIEPLPYLEFVAMMRRSHLILTDSGGVQEEAPSLGKPVLVMRETTERPEGLEAGTVCLVGTRKEQIVGDVSRILTDTDAYARMAQGANPYGDGKACSRIVQILTDAKNKGRMDNSEVASQDRLTKCRGMIDR